METLKILIYTLFFLFNDWIFKPYSIGIFCTNIILRILAILEILITNDKIWNIYRVIYN